MKRSKIFWGIFLCCILGCSSIEFPNHTANLWQWKWEEEKEKEHFSKNIEEPPGALALSQAIQLSLQKNPEFPVFLQKIRIQEVRSKYPSPWPNPEIEGSLEEWGGRKTKEGFRSSESSLVVRQPIPWSGRIEREREVFFWEKNLSLWDYELKKMEIYFSTCKAFWRVFFAQENLKIAENLKESSLLMHQAISEMAKAGKVSFLEKGNAKIALSMAQIEWEKAKQQLDSLRNALSMLWGKADAQFKTVSGNFYSMEKISPVEYLQSRISLHPEILRYTVEIQKQNAILKKEHSKALPDFSIQGGLRYSSEADSTSFILGFSFPLPILDRNQGERASALEEIKKILQEQKAFYQKLLFQLSQSYKEFISGEKELKVLRDEILPQAEQAMEISREGYRQGKFSYLQMMEARKTFFQLKKQYVEAMLRYHLLRVEIAQLCAQKIY